MKIFYALVLALLTVVPAVAAPAGWSRPGGYYEQAASLKSLAEWEEKRPQWCAEEQTPEEDDCIYVDTDL